MLPESNRELSGLFRQVSLLTNKLIDECEQRKIKILSHEEVGLNPNKGNCIGYGPIFSEERAIIVCSKRFFRWCDTASQVELILAHEMGHAIIKDEEPSCCFTPFKHFNRYCRYLELRAEYEGLKILDKLCGGIKNWVYNDIHGKIDKQQILAFYQIESFLRFRTKRPAYCRNCPYQEEIRRYYVTIRGFLE